MVDRFDQLVVAMQSSGGNSIEYSLLVIKSHGGVHVLTSAWGGEAFNAIITNEELKVSM